MNRTKTLLVLAVLAVPAVLAAAAMAVPTVTPTLTTSPANTTGFLTASTLIDDASVASFARAIKQDQGSAAVLQYVRLPNGAQTGWHTHAGPAIVLVRSGQLNYIGDDCAVREYPAGNGFVDAGFGNVHNARAVGDTELYVLYYLPESASTVRDNVDPLCTS